MCIVSHNCQPTWSRTSQCVWETDAELPTGILKEYGLGINFAIMISQELHLFSYTVVIKQGKLQHAAV